MSSLHQPPPRRFCGVCLFELPADVSSDDTDVPDPFAPACEEPGIEVENLERSARRRCETCAKIREILTVEDEFRYILWKDGYLHQVVSFDTRESQEMVYTYMTSIIWELYSSDDKLSLRNNHSQTINSGHPHVHIGSHPTGYTGSRDALTLATAWLSRCCEEHVTCGTTADKPLPSRILVLEDQPDQNSVAIRLVENSTVSGKYACLSHRWGSQTSDVCLTKSNLDSFRKGIDISSLYPMLIEAVHTAHILGIKYLWVDCLCIVQDDPQDWQREAATMGSVYGNAFVTIMATWCANGDTNLFSENRTEKHEIGRLSGQPVFLRQKLNSHPAQVPQGKHNSEAPHSDVSKTLLSRGWVYQERHMSNRIIHFTEEELFWECREASWCECRSGEVEWAERRRNTPRTIANQDWKETIQKYFQLNLSFHSDKLPALAAIAKSFGEPKGFKYVAGIWDKEIGDTFLWHIISQRCERIFPRFAPTWSWASLIPQNPAFALVHWQRCQTVEFSDYQVKPVGVDHYGHLEISRLTVSGPVFNATMLYSEDWIKAVSDSSMEPGIRKVLLNKIESEDDQDLYGLRVDDQYVLFDPDYSIRKAKIDRGYISSGSEVLCMNFGSQFKRSHPGEDDIKYGYGLVLHCVDERENLYERIGTFGMSIDNDINTTGFNGKWLPNEWILNVAKEAELILV